MRLVAFLAGPLYVVAACSSTVTGTGAPLDGGAGVPPAGGPPAPGAPPAPGSAEAAPGGESAGLVFFDVDTFCDNLVSCTNTYTRDQCVTSFTPAKVTPACADALTSATCADFKAEHASFEPTCYPPCDVPGAQHCNGDGTFSVCLSTSQTSVFDCARWCVAHHLTWVGVCGSSYQTQTATKEQCWCT